MADDTTSSPDEREHVDAGAPEAAPAAEVSTPDEATDPQGEGLVGELADPGEYEIADDETEAEELVDADETVDDTPDKGDPDDVVIDDPEQLAEAETVAAAARSSRPVRKTPQATTGAVTPKKATATRKQSAGGAVDKPTRTTPGVFVNQSVAELRKVQWPTGDQLRQYFIVVLVFVLIIIAYVGLLDFAFGWVVLKLFGAGTP
ncbi:preprotein translocase subunit SecE [Aestuariimicrobium soli]|uniref:preprotein translocase subunit SecE n=1 Tax=Aestuariimicrobium soli TaxID=2035834 RepID=UPI003EBB59E2